MKIRAFRSPLIAALMVSTLALPPGSLLGAQAKPQPAATATPPVGTNADTGWPRTPTLKSGTAVVYQPQVESWANQKHLVAYSAVAYTPTGAKEPALGTIKIEGDTRVAVDDRVVNVEFHITEYNFKTLSPQQIKTLVNEVQALPAHERVLDLDRVTAYARKSVLNVKNAEGIKADPPKIFSSTTPAVLLSLDGDVIWGSIKDVDLKFAVNTNWDLFEHTPTATLYLRHNESWLTAKAVAGPWTAVTTNLPDSFKKLPADDNWKDVRTAVPGKKLNAKNTPKVFVSTEAAELILLEGQPSYLVVEGAPTLMWVNNTESDLFRAGRSGDFYYLVAGRWFKSASLEGPWTFATPNLPEDFKKIPEEHPRSRVLASVPGTEEATEAVLLAQLPRTARVNKKELKAPDVTYAGDKPEFKTIEGAKGLEQAVNTDKDIIKFGDLYYMCFQGVWFMSKSASGPWEVTDSVPKEIYSIPASSSVHHVTYVTVEEDDDDEWVTFAYVAAYTGLMIGWGCAVWGSGWYYPPYYYGGFYYPYPRTYGMGAWYNPRTGAYGRGYAAYGPYGGAGFGASYNPRTGTYARGAAAYGPYGSARAAQAYNPRTGTYAQTRQGSNIYGNWGSSSVQRGDEWAQTAHRTNYGTGSRTSGVRTDEGAGAVTRTGQAGRTTVGRTEGGDVYAGHDGNVYKRNDDGSWQQHGDGGWSNVDRSTAQAGQLERDSSARATGNQRTADRGTYQQGGGQRSGAGSYRGGGGARGGGGRRR
jgi:hypothetical protein